MEVQPEIIYSALASLAGAVGILWRRVTVTADRCEEDRRRLLAMILELKHVTCYTEKKHE